MCEAWPHLHATSSSLSSATVGLTTPATHTYGRGFRQGCEAKLAATERDMFVLTQQLQSERELREETSATLLIQSQECTIQLDELHVRTRPQRHA